MQNLDGKKIAILATDGFEQSELEQPLKALKDAGAHVDVISPGDAGSIKGWDKKDWGRWRRCSVRPNCSNRHCQMPTARASRPACASRAQRRRRRGAVQGRPGQL